jgi:hypothetical protein
MGYRVFVGDFSNDPDYPGMHVATCETKEEAEDAGEFFAVRYDAAEWRIEESEHGPQRW